MTDTIDPALLKIGERLFAECGDAASKAMLALQEKHDTRLIFYCVLAEVAHTAAVLRKGKVLSSDQITKNFVEALHQALTLETKEPKFVYRIDGKDIEGGTKQ